MKFLAILGLAQCLMACSFLGKPTEVKKCEEQILSKLEKPESYASGEYATLNLGSRWQVGIEYSYMDRGGSRIERAWQTCDYPVIDGKPDTSKFLESKGSLGSQKARISN